MSIDNTRFDGRELPERIPAVSLDAMSQDEFYRRHPPAEFVGGLLKRRKQLFRPMLALAAGGALAAAAAVVLFIVVPVTDDGPRTGVKDRPFGTVGDTTDKGIDHPDNASAKTGEPALYVEVLRKRRFEAVQDGQQLHPDEVVRFFYDTSAHDFLYVFSVDAYGKISTYYPEETSYSVPIVRGKHIPLPEGVQLDDYRGYERFFALFTDVPLSYWQVELAVRSTMSRHEAAGLGIEALTRLPIDCQQETFLFEKR